MKVGDPTKHIRTEVKDRLNWTVRAILASGYFHIKVNGPLKSVRT